MKKNKKKKLKKETYIYASMIFVYLYLFGACIYKYVTTHKISNCAVELFFMIVLSCLVAYAVTTKEQRINKLRQFFLSSKNDKKKERMKSYLINSLFISLVITTFIATLVSIGVIDINLYSYTSNIIQFTILSLLLIFVVSFVLVFFSYYYINEKLVRKSKRRK